MPVTKIKSIIISGSSTAVVLKNLYGHGNGMIQINCDSPDVCSQLADNINSDCNSIKADSTTACFNSTQSQPSITDCATECVPDVNSPLCTSLGAITQSDCQDLVDKQLSDCAAKQIAQFCHSSTAPNSSNSAIIIASAVAGGFALLAILFGTLYCKRRRERNAVLPAQADAAPQQGIQIVPNPN